MQAVILSIGDELTLGQNLNTNSCWLADQLGRHGVVTIEHRMIDDDRVRIAAAVQALAADHELLIVTGGLGPTDDDLTREALNDVLSGSQALVVDEEARGWLDRWFSKRHTPMPEANLRQAMRPETMRCIPNPHGTAPGLAGELNGCLVFALPGPPREMRPMFTAYVLPALGRSDQDAVILAAKVNEFGIGESDAAERLGELTARDRHPLIGTTASDSIVSARIRARGRRDEIEPLIEADCMEIQQRWWPYAFSRDETALEEVVGMLLRERHRTVATAESCTGGWLGKQLIDVPGSSAYYLGGWVTYTNEMKALMLGVPTELIQQHGAVSREVAETMAIGALERTGADEAIAISGIAGPSGGTKEKPVGTVHIALSRRVQNAVRTSARHFVFSGDRTTIRDRSVKAALQMLRFALLEVDEAHLLLWEAARGKEANPVEYSMPSADTTACVDAYISLGSNLGDRAEMLHGALAALSDAEDVEVLTVSEFIETEPVGPGEQGRYLNAAAKLRTSRPPRELLELLLSIERAHGRDRSKEERWGPRRLDLDVLLYAEAVIDEPGLTIPHPRLHERSFVLDPLVKIAGDFRHPLLGESIQSIRDRLPSGRS